MLPETVVVVGLLVAFLPVVIVGVVVAVVAVRGRRPTSDPPPGPLPPGAEPGGAVTFHAAPCGPARTCLPAASSTTYCATCALQGGEQIGTERRPRGR